MLRELQDLQPFYSRNTCPDLVQDFFVPLLNRAVRYDRTTFTFGPRALTIAAAGLAGLINNGGYMRLICHHELPKEVVQAILEGHRTVEDALLESPECQAVMHVAPDDLADRQHLDLLTWLVKEGRLDIKVAIPRYKYKEGIFHQKIGLFTDERGDCVGFNGGLNESQMGWLHSDENLTLFKSWDNPDHLQPLINEFERLWTNRADTSIVIPIPEALRQRLIRFAPTENPARKSRSFRKEARKAVPKAHRIRLWTAIKHAVAHDPQTTIETVAAQLWPHQLSFWRRHARDVDEPPRVLIADEVGLGKTIQAGALLKTLINRGQDERILILTPAVSRWQWQDELRHKFNIPVPVLDRVAGRLRLCNADGTREKAGSFPWQQTPWLILSYDWLRRHQRRFFADDFPDYDMVVFDEAHHARYQEVTSPSRRRKNSYLCMLEDLAARTRGLLLLTATPMQMDSAELWALLQVLDPAGQWTESEFRVFFDVDRPLTLHEWDRARRTYLQDGLPGSIAQIAELARMSLSEVRDHLQYIEMSASNPALKRYMTPDRIGASLALMRRSAAVKHSVSRHTRNLLRQYAREDWLGHSVPERDVRSIPVTMNDEERSLYDDIGDFVRQWYRERINVNRRALGFTMTHFRLRLGSSRYAFQQSLMTLRQHQEANAQAEVEWTEVLDSDEGDSYSDLDPDAAAPALELVAQEEQMLSSLLSRCKTHAARDSKFVEFLVQLTRLQEDGYNKVMVFSQFRDTQVWLRQHLAIQTDQGLLAGLSGAEDWLFDPTTDSFQSVDRKTVMERFRNEADGILLCTDTAAESLNFQFCAAIVNYDIPWNPMRLEQRIGRIDRIGQARETIRVVHLFYRDTAEYDAYEAMEERIQSFTEHVGTLQPILVANLEKIIRQSAVDKDDSLAVREAVNNLSPSGFDLDDLAAAALHQQDPTPQLHLNDLTYILDHPEWLPDGYTAEGAGLNHWKVTVPDGARWTVTTDRKAHDYAAGTVEFFGPGNIAFPDLTALELDDETIQEPLQGKVSTILNSGLASTSPG